MTIPVNQRLELKDDPHYVAVKYVKNDDGKIVAEFEDHNGVITRDPKPYQQPPKENIHLQASNPSTSFYTLKSWGGLDKENCVLVEQLDKNTFMYNDTGRIGIAYVTRKLQSDNPKKKIFSNILEINNKTYALPKNIWSAAAFYVVPPVELALSFVRGELKAKTIHELLLDIEIKVRTLYDFPSDSDVGLLSLYILQTYCKPFCDEFAFLAIDATKGGGKTTLLENAAIITRHGFLAGDISPAAIPRIVEEIDGDMFYDELDQKIGKGGEEDSIAVIRKGQRRGNPYVRVNKHTMMPEQFDVAGCHAFSYRSELEDAFMMRAMSIHTGTSRDNRLPVLNTFKKEVLCGLKYDLFFWMMQNAHILLASVSATNSAVRETELTGSVSDRRQKLYEKITSGYNDSELHILNTFTGRNNELAFLLIRLTRLLHVDFVSEIKGFMTAKVEDDLSSTNAVLELLSDFLTNKYQSLIDIEGWKLKTGTNEGCVYYPKNSLFNEFTIELKNKNLSTISTRKFASLLRDLGFRQGESITVQRPVNATPRPCLVFTEPVKKALVEGVEGCRCTPDTIRQTINEHDSGEGVAVEVLLNKFSSERNKVETIINNMLNTGDLFEWKPGRVRVL